MAQENEQEKMVAGFLLLLGAHIIAIAIVLIMSKLLFSVVSNLPTSVGGGIGGMINAIPIIALSGLGLTQLIYVIPMVMQLNRRRKYALMKGVVIGAVLTALLNGSCWVYFITNFRP